MEARPQFWDTLSPLFEDGDCYRRFLGKLIYLTVTCPDIIYVVSVLSQFIQNNSTSSLGGNSTGSSIHQASHRERAYLSMTQSSPYRSLL